MDDSFKWLEDSDSVRTVTWVRSASEHTIRALSADPRFPKLQQLAMCASSARKDEFPEVAAYNRSVRDGWYYELAQNASHPRGIWRRAMLDSLASLHPLWQNLLDVDAFATEEGRQWEFCFGAQWEPKTGRCLLGFSESYGSKPTWREFDVERAAFVKDGFVLPEASGQVAWKNPHTLLVVRDWGPGSLSKYGAPLVIKEWERGEPLSRAKEVFRGMEGMMVLPRAVDDGPDDRLIYLLEVDADPSRGTIMWALNEKQRFERTVLPADSRSVALCRREFVFPLRRDWTVGDRTFKAGSVVSVSYSDVWKSAPRVRVLVEPSERTSVSDIQSSRGGVLICEHSNMRARVSRFTFDDSAWHSEALPLPDNGTIAFLAASAYDDVALATFEGFLSPATLYRVDVRGKRASAIRCLQSTFDSSPYAVEQREAISADGTPVPYFIVARHGAFNTGDTPAYIHAYGAFGASQYPSYLGTVGPLWLEQGGAYVLANIRGGGEFGPTWHLSKAQRQRVYEDLYAVASDLVARSFTSPEHLGIEGLSAGGLLVGVAITQWPELFNAAVLQVGVLDLARWTDFGRSDAAGDEFGSMTVPEERAFILRTSPYANLRRGTRYPAPLIMTATNDDRVHPGHSRKFAARLDQLEIPHYFYESPEGGHGMAASPDQIALRDALIFTYLAHRLIPYRLRLSSEANPNDVSPIAHD